MPAWRRQRQRQRQRQWWTQRHRRRQRQREQQVRALEIARFLEVGTLLTSAVARNRPGGEEYVKMRFLQAYLPTLSK